MASFMRIQVVDSEKSPHIQMTNQKEETRLAKDVQRLDRSRALVVNKIKVEQKTTYRRFQRKLQQSQVHHARIMCDKETERRLLRRQNFTFNTRVSDDTEQALKKVWQPSVDLEERLKRERKSPLDIIPMIIEDEFDVPPRKVRTSVGVWENGRESGKRKHSARADLAKSAPPIGRKGQIQFVNNEMPKRTNSCIGKRNEREGSEMKRPMTCKSRTRTLTGQSSVRCPSARPAPRSPSARLFLPEGPSARCTSASHLKTRLPDTKSNMVIDNEDEDDVDKTPVISVTRDENLSSDDDDDDEDSIFDNNESNMKTPANQELESFDYLRPDTAPSPTRPNSFGRNSPLPRGVTSAPAARHRVASGRRGSTRSVSFNFYEDEKKPSLLEVNRERTRSANYEARIKSFGETIRPLKIAGGGQMMDYYNLRLVKEASARVPQISPGATPLPDEVIRVPLRVRSLTMKQLDYDWNC